MGSLEPTRYFLDTATCVFHTYSVDPSSNEIGSLVALYRYPVKSMMGEEINSSVVTEKGLLGDRQFALIDPSTGKAASAKNPSKWPNLFSFRAFYTEAVESTSRIPPVRISLPDGRTILNHDVGVDTVLSEAIGKSVHLSTSQGPESSVYEEFWPDLEGLARRDVVTEEAMPPGTFFDLATIHILTTATIDKLRELYPAGRFEPRRFRPNLIICPNQGNGFLENDWIDQTLMIADKVSLKVTGPCTRCVMTTLAQGDLPRDTGILKTAAKHNQVNVGVYASVLTGGVIRRGDVVRIEGA
jgi:MOSC domain-containing protein